MIKNIKHHVRIFPSSNFSQTRKNPIIVIDYCSYVIRKFSTRVHNRNHHNFRDVGPMKKKKKVSRKYSCETRSFFFPLHNPMFFFFFFRRSSVTLFLCRLIIAAVVSRLLGISFFVLLSRVC